MEAIVFLTLIINVSTNPNCLLKFKNAKYNTLGNISYGIYMYHTIVIAIMFSLLQKTGLSQSPILFNGVLYASAVLGTIGLAYLSYMYFESWFLHLKEKFMVVKSSSKNILPENINVQPKTKHPEIVFEEEPVSA